MWNFKNPKKGPIFYEDSGTSLDFQDSTVLLSTLKMTQEVSSRYCILFKLRHAGWYRMASQLQRLSSLEPKVCDALKLRLESRLTSKRKSHVPSQPPGKPPGLGLTS
jgi:hypothetical protein